MFSGNERDASNLQRLRELNISHILNITSHIPKYFENQGIKYKRLPASDSGCQNLRQYFDEAIQFIGKFNWNNNINNNNNDDDDNFICEINTLFPPIVIYLKIGLM